MNVDGNGGSDLAYCVVGETQLRLLDVSIEDSDSFSIVLQPLILFIGQNLTAKGPKAPICRMWSDPFCFTISQTRTALHLGQATKGDGTES